MDETTSHPQHHPSSHHDAAAHGGAGHGANASAPDGNASSTYLIAASFILASVILSAALLYSLGGLSLNLQQINSGIGELNVALAQRGPGTVQATPVPSGSTIAPGVDLQGFPVKGSSNAPVTIVEYSDFQCPFCQRFYSDTLPDVLKNYVDSGKAKIYFKQFPLASLHPLAQKAAEASECAKDQGKFWEYHDRLFGSQQLDAASLKKHAADLGLDAVKFNTCLDGGSKAATVAAQQAEGSKLGVSGTPTFYINGEALIGAQPYSEFQRVLDSKLAA